MIYYTCIRITIYERKKIMKKLLSLILAVMMVLSVAITVGAADTTSINDELAELILGNKNPWFGWNPNGDNLYTRWYGSCPECGNTAFYYVKNGNIKWECRDSACGKSGTIYAPGYDDDGDDDGYFVPTTDQKCSCGTSKNLKYVSREYNKTDKEYRYTFKCTKCNEYVEVGADDVEFSGYPWYPDYPTYPDYPCYPEYPDFPKYDKSSVLCSYGSCYCQAYFQNFFYDCGVWYALYKCPEGHETTKKVYTYDGEYFMFNINVITTRGGSFYIEGGSKAAYGSTRKITFRADSGYALTDIYVNGEKVKTEDEIFVTVEGHVTVRAYFTKISELKNYTVRASAIGGGKITAVMNGKSVDPSKLYGKYTDSITYRFVPDSDNYYISSIKINGRSVGKVSTYTLSRLTGDTTIEVEFAWDCPYDDVAATSKYIDAIEYVTEAGILKGSATATLKPQYNFYGNRAVTVKTAACALAEMADVKDALSNNTDRISWAIDKGLIDKNEDTSIVCDVQRLCGMVKEYLDYLEDKNDISFVDVNSSDSAKEVAISINMVTSKTYNANRNISKYDLAAVLYLISGLEYVDVE